MAKAKLFISHAPSDRGLAAALVELLVSCTALKSPEIAYSTLTAGVPEGKDFITQLGTQIQGEDAVVVLLSKHYYTNRVCLCEMGALWAMTRHIMPLLVPPLTQDHVQEILSGTPLDHIDNTDDLNKLVTRLQAKLGLGDLNLPRWSMEKKRFLTSLPSFIAV